MSSVLRGKTRRSKSVEPGKDWKPAVTDSPLPTLGAASVRRFGERRARSTGELEAGGPSLGRRAGGLSLGVHAVSNDNSNVLFVTVLEVRARQLQRSQRAR